MKTNKKLTIAFTILNIVIGWHLLYEGIVKILDPGWTSASYLVNAKGIFAGLFQSIAESPILLQISDIANMAGLTIIGLLIFLGLFTRYAALAGAVLLGMYYLASPPWNPTNVGYGVEGHYLVVNKNLVEIIVLLVIAFVPRDWYFGLDNLVPKVKKEKVNAVHVPDEMNHDVPKNLQDRRTLIKNLISLPFIGGFAFAVAKNHGWKSYEEEHLAAKANGTDASTSPTIKVNDAVDLTSLKKPVPKGKLGNLEVGRIICGGNLISGFAHSRDLIYVSSFLKKYFTEKKIMDTFWLCEECGINTTAVSARKDETRILNDYWKKGGKMQWIAPTYPKEDNYRENIDFALDNGASAVLIMGNIGDRWAHDGKYELMAKTLDYIKSKGVQAGLAGHDLETFKGAEKHQVGADFYMKTLHSRNYWSWKPEQTKDRMVIDNYRVDNYWDRNPDETIAFMESLDKPWIAFKILAAGAVHPKDGFRFAFEKGADFAVVGMFDFQVVENANLLTDILENNEFSRKRTWIG